MAPERYLPASYLEWNAERRPDAAAVWDGRDISFRKLQEAVEKARRHLAERGFKAGDVVGVQLPNTWEFVALELAIPGLGAVILPLPLNLGEHEMRWIEQKARPSLIVRDMSFDSAPGPAPDVARPDQIG